ncbi:hypothetical protein PLEOSDRAFT_1106462 [Pleurotus ostreatus PC15]|uniref:Uncharacterized protein n=1 Tax=Pleurotus ostreatus (strain PC15) TaxID=1137138 RepID=A0A067NBX2_PLEO1|nr:hypothetical protein PLEOSDRAFT_1106462 [Pleurotus ostreatus PC15]
MNCCCSNCFGISKRLRARKTIRSHLKQDRDLVLNHEHDPVVLQFLQDCIRQNVELLEQSKRSNSQRADPDAMDVDDSGGPMSVLDPAHNNDNGQSGEEIEENEEQEPELLHGIAVRDTEVIYLDQVNIEELPSSEDPYYVNPSGFDVRPSASESESDDGMESDEEEEEEEEEDSETKSEAESSSSDNNTGSVDDDDSDSELEADYEAETQFSFPASRKALIEKMLDGYKAEPVPPRFGLKPIALTKMQIYSLSHWTVFQLTNTTRRAHEAYAKLLSKALGQPIMSIDRCRRLAQKITDFMPKYIPICPGKCIAFTGDHKDKTVCDFLRKQKKGPPLVCGRDRNRPGTTKPAAQFMVLPLVPIIRAMFANYEKSYLLRYRDRLVKAAIELFMKGAEVKYSDYANGKAHMEHLMNQGLFEHECDMIYIMSIDGAMLTLKKQSDSWFLILIILNLLPDIRYLAENVITVFSTPGPEPPGDLSTYMYPVVQELLQMGQGIWIWDAFDSAYIMHHASVVGQSADQPGQNKDNGHLGINSLHGNFFNLKLIGMRSSVKGCKRIYWCVTVPEGAKKFNPGRPDYDLDNLPEFTEKDYWNAIQELEGATDEKSRKHIVSKYGIVRLPMLAAFETYSWPKFFFSDPFHLLYENNMANFWDLWTTITGPDEITHLSVEQAAFFGKEVAKSMETIPAAFTGPVRDPHTKRNTQYKMFEWKALAHWLTIPILLELEMPMAVVRNFARFVKIVTFAMEITGRTENDLTMIRKEIVTFLNEFQELYVPDETKASRMRLSMFHLLYIPDHIRWNGSYRIGSQGTLERHIGVLERRIKSRKEPFVNLANKIYEGQLVKNLLHYYPSLAVPDEEPRPRVAIGKVPILKREKKEKNSIYNQHLQAICKWLNVSFNIDPEATWLVRLGKVPLPSGVYLRSRLNES